MSLPRYFFQDCGNIIDEYQDIVAVEVPEDYQRDWFHANRHDYFGTVYLEMSGLYYNVRKAWEAVELWFTADIIDEPMRTMIAYLFQMTENGMHWSPEFTLPLYKDGATGCFIEGSVPEILFQFFGEITPLSCLAVIECPNRGFDENSLLTEMNDLYDPYVIDMYEFEWNHGGRGVPREVMEAALEVDPVNVVEFVHDEGPRALFNGAGTEDDPIDLISTTETEAMTDDEDEDYEVDV
jgi:hypothetical protein